MKAVVLVVATAVTILGGCRNAPSPLSLGSNAQAVIPSDFPTDAAQVLVGADELIVHTSGDWMTRNENGVEIREPNGFGTHTVQVVGIRGDAQYSTPPITVYVGGEVVVAKALCFVDVRDHGRWNANASMADANPAMSAAGCDGVYSNTVSVVWTTPTSGQSCWSDLTFNENTGGWSRTCNRPNATINCEARVNFADGTHKDVTFGCNTTPAGGFRGNGSTVSINGSTSCQ